MQRERLTLNQQIYSMKEGKEKLEIQVAELNARLKEIERQGQMTHDQTVLDLRSTLD